MSISFDTFGDARAVEVAEVPPKAFQEAAVVLR
jgi:hypothetical protein